MKLAIMLCRIIYLLVHIFVITANPVETESDSNDLLRRFIYVEREDGSMEYVDLLQETDEEVQPMSSDVIYYLYTKSNQHIPYKISNGSFMDLNLPDSPYDPERLNLFVIHGWMNNAMSMINLEVRGAALEYHDVNVFVVDWGRLAYRLYTTAKSCVGFVGDELGAFIGGMQTTFGLTAGRFLLAGHSLGAHVAGRAGFAAGGALACIVGLDPAFPLYYFDGRPDRLDDTDAQFVHVIHTNGKMLGYPTALGHADYFPNGGMAQPGCGLDLAGSCSHTRAYQYFAESLSRGPLFVALNCANYRHFETGTCPLANNSTMGQIHIDKTASGKYYLDTNDIAPYAMG